MPYRLLLSVFILVFFGCDQSTTSEAPQQTIKEKRLVIDTSAISLYSFDETNPLIDSLLLDLEAFKNFRASIEDLSKLNPRGLSPFLINARVNTNKLLKTSLPSPFETADIRSRLKVVKTQLLRVSYYSTQEKYDELNPALFDLYDAYKAYLLRIEDFAQTTKLGAEINLNNELKLE